MAVRKDTQGARGGRKKAASRHDSSAPDHSLASVAKDLLGSGVRAKLPRRICARLDRAILDCSSTGKPIEAIARELRLQEYGITRAALTEYASRLDELLRPVAAARVIAGVLGCLPARHRRRILAGNQLLLLSRVANVLAEAEPDDLQIADLVKLGSVLRTAAQSRRTARTGGSRREIRTRFGEIEVLDRRKMTQAVRLIYGLSWPPPTIEKPPSAECVAAMGGPNTRRE